MKCLQVAVCSHAGQSARRWAACTGLSDCPLLPPLFTDIEDSYSQALILQVYLRLCSRAGVRPIGVAVDDLAASWRLLSRTLTASMPAIVRTAFVYDTEGLSEEQQNWIDTGGILIDQDHHKVYGLLVAQDPLHVFFRLSQAIDWKSMDSAWSLRALRKLLRGWNYETEDMPDESFARAEHNHDLPWLVVDDNADSSTVHDILVAYFSGLAVPYCAFDVLAASVDEAYTSFL